MNGVLALVAAATLGIDVGWQPLDDGGFEYIIQLEPQTLDSLRDGQDLSSQLPPSLQGVRTYRITVGNGPLPHEGEPPPVTPGPAAVAKVPATGPIPQTTYQVPPPPAAEVPTNPNFAPSGATAPSGMPGPTPGPNGGGGRRYGAGITNAGPAPPADSSTQPGLLRGLPPPPADPSVPPLHTDADPAPTTPPSNPPYEPPPATPRPSLGTDPGGTAPASPGFMQSPLPSAPTGTGGSSSAPGFSYPGSSPAMRGESKAEPPPASAPAESAVERFKQREAAAAKSTAVEEEQKDPPTKDRASAKEPTPWLPLIGTLLALFASLGGNIFLGWNTMELRSRYRALAAQLHAS